MDNIDIIYAFKFYSIIQNPFYSKCVIEMIPKFVKFGYFTHILRNKK